LHYIVRLLYDFEPKEFLKQTWFEGIMMAILVIDFFGYNLFGKLLIQTFFEELGFQSYRDISTVFIQSYLLIIVGVEIGKSSTLIPIIKIHPANLFILSFLLIISMGTFLLMLPEMTVKAGSMSFMEALFTSTSATCVTGLTIVDTATFFTYKGQAIILLLIKLGGLNIVAFGSFIALAAKFGVGVKHHSVIEGFINKESIFSSHSMFGKIIAWSIAVEVIGATIIYFLWDVNVPFINIEQKVFYSFFHSVSAFNNAGFSVFTDGLFNDYVRHNFLVHIVIAALVFFGSLGFTSLFDLFTVKKLRQRLKYPWKHIEFSTKISLYFSIGLVLIGAILFFVLEKNNTLHGQNTFEAMITSLFQSITTRTAGFNTIDIGSMTVPTLFVFLTLMFIGASSSSTGGGIKTSTFALLFASTVSAIKDNRNIELFKRTIPTSMIKKAFAILIFYLLLNLLGVFLLSITETEILHNPNYSVMNLLFEQVSAMGTVGLSTGITSHLSETGRVIIIFSMFIGRVGTLTLAYALGNDLLSRNYKYPEGYTMVG
jgi:trk system potassium uptake protein